MELVMAKNRMKENKRPDESQPERRIIETEYDDIVRVIEFKVYAVQPDGKARVVGGGAFEKQDLERVAEELIDLADHYADSEAYIRGLFKGIEKDEGEDG
jgi:hypothetical protein